MKKKSKVISNTNIKTVKERLLYQTHLYKMQKEPKFHVSVVNLERSSKNYQIKPKSPTKTYPTKQSNTHIHSDI